MKDVNQKNLNRENILSYLNIDKKIKVNVEIFNQIDSTNSYLLNKKQVINELNICIAEMQTKGKGRSGKVWESPKKKNIYLSIGTLLNKEISELDGFSILIALMICNALEDLYKIKAKIKWPNDLYLKNKKFGGILIETKMVNKKLSISKFNEPSSLTSRAIQSDDEKFDTRTFLFFNILRLSKSFLNALKPFSKK